MFKNHKKIGSQGHEFPKKEKIKGVPDRDHEKHGQDEKVIEKTQKGDVFLVLASIFF